MTTLGEIKQLMAAGDTAQADAALKELLAKEPNNLEAKMLYGTCRQLLGDEESFKRIHDELASVMETLAKREPNQETVSLWKKYHALWMSLIVGGLVLVGLGYGIYIVNKEMEGMFATSAYRGPVMPDCSVIGRPAASLYAGPPRKELGTGPEIGSSKKVFVSDDEADSTK